MFGNPITGEIVTYIAVVRYSTGISSRAAWIAIMLTAGPVFLTGICIHCGCRSDDYCFFGLFFTL